MSDGSGGASVVVVVVVVVVTAAAVATEWSEFVFVVDMVQWVCMVSDDDVSRMTAIVISRRVVVASMVWNRSVVGDCLLAVVCSLRLGTVNKPSSQTNSCLKNRSPVGCPVTTTKSSHRGDR